MQLFLKYLLLIVLVIPFYIGELIGQSGQSGQEGQTGQNSQNRIRILKKDLKSTGIGLRIGVFKMSDQPLLVDVNQDNDYSNVKVGYFCEI